MALTGLEAERRIFANILDLCIDETVLHLLLPDGRPYDYETSLWDYKRHLPDTTGRGNRSELEAAEFEIAELVKDVAAFHNTFGGYIICGVDHLRTDTLTGCSRSSEFKFTVEKLNEQVRKYTGKDIQCRFQRFEVDNGKGTKVCVGLLAIPMRATSDAVVRMAKGCREGSNQPFRKNDIFARLNDSSVPVSGNAQALQLLCSERKFGQITDRKHLEHNLPPRDPNLITFIGRAEYLLQLWSWQLERHSPVKVLTALGGTGKTAIAYEYCLQLISNPPSWLQKVVWLSAKKQTFSAVQGKYYSVTRVDFSNIANCLEALARELGIMEGEIKEANGDIEELTDRVLEGLTEFPSVIVIDDVDTLEIDEQNNLFSTFQSLAGQSFDKGSRFLFTSRLEFGADSQRIQITGFEQKEFLEYVKTVAKNLNINISEGLVNQLHRASKGSPVFASSILRLASSGLEIHQAIKQWKGKAGEDVRKFAFQREIDQLTESQSRTLYALATLGETTLLELSQVLEVDATSLTSDLLKLREFHLFASRDNPGTGARLEVPEPVMLMRDVIASRITDPKRIERDCLRARSQSPRVQDKVAFAIGQIVALWQADDYEAALIVCSESLKSNSKSGDLWCMLGQCNLKITPQKAQEADKAFTKAWQNNCRRPELVMNWMIAKAQSFDWVGISDLAHQFAPSAIRDQTALIVVIAEFELGNQAIGRNDPNKALVRLKEAMTLSSRTIAQGRAGDSIAEIREVCREAAHRYISLVDRESVRAGDKIDVFNAVYDAFKCHVSESRLLALGNDALRTWAADMFSRRQNDPEPLRILERRLDQLQEIISLCERQGARMPELTEKLRDTKFELEAKLHRARNTLT